MTNRSILIAVAAAFLGFVGGFMFANQINRSQMPVPTPASPATDSTTQQTADQARGGTTLTPEEIKSKLDAADRNPTDFVFQKNLGMALYRYASLKQDSSLLPDAIRILQRASDLDPADRDLQIALGNAYFDVGYFNKDNKSLERARDFYKKALVRVPNDVDVRTDLALTYYLQNPPDLATAVAEFESGLKINPKHERSLGFLVQAYVKQNEIVKASETLDRLKAANPSNSSINELMTMIAGGNPPTAK